VHEQGECAVAGGGENNIVTAQDQPPALACHLDATNYQQRIRRFADLNRECLLESRRLDLGFELTYSLKASAELRDLVGLEEECCPFLRFQLEPEQTSIKLSILVPQSARNSVDALLEPFCTT
jgi:hypothetical protein